MEETQQHKRKKRSILQSKIRKPQKDISREYTERDVHAEEEIHRGEKIKSNKNKKRTRVVAVSVRNKQKGTMNSV
jgi:phosphorylcholine metabolism protein LicD